MYVHIEQQQTKYHCWNNFHRHFLILLIFHSVISQFPVLLFYFNCFVNQICMFCIWLFVVSFFYHFLSIEYTYFPKYFLLWALPLPYLGLVLDFCSLFLDLEIFFLFSIFSSFVSILNIPVYKFEILI